MSFKTDDAVRVLHPCCEIHTYGLITDTPKVSTPFGFVYEVDFEDNEKKSFVEAVIVLDKRPVEKGSLVVFYKSFDTIASESGFIIHGSFIQDKIGECGRVIEKQRDGLCRVMAIDFSWEYWIPEDSLFVIISPIHDLGTLDLGSEMYLHRPYHSMDLEIDWNEYMDFQNGNKCKVLDIGHAADYPCYLVQFEDGGTQFVYQGWLLSTPTIVTDVKDGKSQDITYGKGVTNTGGIFTLPVVSREYPKEISDNGVNYIDLGNGIRMFETGAVRSVNHGKPRFDLISPLATKWMAECLASNSGTYGTGNYLLGIPEKICIESLERHLNVVKIGLATGDKSMIDEASNLMVNAMFLCHTIKLKESGDYVVSDEFKKLLDGQARKSQTA